MEKKQPDFKKSQTNPYDLNSRPSSRDRGPNNPSPYDLDQGGTQLPNRQDKERKEK
jgi:hypothetical protein